MEYNATSVLFQFLVNDGDLFQRIEQITGCSRIGCFGGSVYRFTPGLPHHDSWHSDEIEDRLVAISVKLSTDVYCGGILQIRDWRSGEIVHETANTGFGDAIVFRIAPHLKHRVSSVSGTVPRTAFAGWFRSRPDYRVLPRNDPAAWESKAPERSDAPITLESRFTIPATVAWRSAEAETILLKPESGHYYGLDPIGGRIWKLWAEKESVHGIVDSMATEDDATLKELEADVLDLARELMMRGLLQIAD